MGKEDIRVCCHRDTESTEKKRPEKSFLGVLGASVAKLAFWSFLLPAPEMLGTSNILAPPRCSFSADRSPYQSAWSPACNKPGSGRRSSPCTADARRPSA